MTTIPEPNLVRQRYTVRSPLVLGSPEVRAMPDLKPLVFVVDDDISVRESLELLIKSAGCSLNCSHRRENSSARPRSLVPSCLVLDVSLPGLDGLELQRQVADRNDMPIVFITG